MFRLTSFFAESKTDLYVLSYGQEGDKPPRVRETYAMAESLVDLAISTSQVPKEKIVAVGHSLGGWMAMHLAATQRVGCVVVAGTGTNVLDAASVLLPASVSYTVSLRPNEDARLLDNVARAKQVDVPTLVLGSKADRTMPEEFSTRIFANLKSQTNSKLFISDATPHSAYFRDPEIERITASFLREKCDA